MPLSPVSPNVKLIRGPAGKGLHTEFVDITTAPCQAKVDAQDCRSLSELKTPAMSTSTLECQPLPSDPPVTTMDSPPGSSPVAITEVDSSTPVQQLAPQNVTPSKSSQLPETTPADSNQQANGKPPTLAPKRKRTAEEKERERAEKKQKQDEAAAEKARIAAEKEAVKATKAAEKANKAAEKARLEAEKEAVKAAKAAEKAKVDAAKEAKKQKKQEEELAAKAKGEKQRNLMASFLKKAPTTPSKTGDRHTSTTKADIASPSSNQGVEPTKSAYELNFKPFFVKPGVTLAPQSFHMDNETKEAKSTILDEHMSGARGDFIPRRPFDAATTFDFAFPQQQRGIIPLSVKKIMETIHGNPHHDPFNTTKPTSESQTERLLVDAQDQLNAIPMKYIRFYEDVRPAYFGTITTPMAYHELRKLSRRPAGRILPLAYDYDSEAEWVEDDGEDLDDAEDEEEDLDGDEEMDDFVDDSEAAPTIIRPGFVADSLPVSTGLCFEDPKRLGPSAVRKYRLEFLLDSLEHDATINPFSTEYWPAPIKKAVAIPAVSSTQGTLTSMLPPAAPRDTSTTLDVKDGVPQDMLESFKRALLSDECKDYSKSTVVEMLAKKFPSCTKAQVKTTLDTIAHRVTPADATKKSVKRWALLPGFSLK